MPLALYTFSLFGRPADDPSNDGFHELNDLIFKEVDRAEGLLARSGYASDLRPEPWGEEVYPNFYIDRGDGWSPATLSLWRDLEAAFAFTYFGLHATALRRGREWFEKPHWPPLVLWWHDRNGHPEWSDGVARLEHLHAQGPTSHAFNFKQPFDRSGQPVKLDMSRVQAMEARRGE